MARSIVAVSTRTGEAMHAAYAGGVKTFCGRKVASTLRETVSANAIEHPWRCDRCNDFVTHYGNTNPGR